MADNITPLQCDNCINYVGKCPYCHRARPEPDNVSPLRCRSAILRRPPDADRTTRFLDLLDVHIANLKTRGLRMACLGGQAKRWEREYQQFIAMVMNGTAELAPNSPTATDYVMTITAIYARLKIEEDMQ